MNTRVTLELYESVRTVHNVDKRFWRRIASLPDCDDELCQAIKSRYSEPMYQVRLITEFT